jgi:hypothetical protein
MRLIYAAAILIAILIAGSAAYYKYAIDTAPVLPKELPQVGKVGSDHAHASLMIMVRDRILNFCSPQYMLKSQYVHFENNDCFTVHRHATGITVPTFLKTLGIALSPDCLTVPADGAYCDNGKDHVRVVVNGKEMDIALLPYYVFRNNDHVLINYGPEEGDMLRFKYNQVPQIPLDVNEPEVPQPYGKVMEGEKEAPLENVK